MNDASPRWILSLLWPGLLVLASGIGRLLAAETAGPELKLDDPFFAQFQPKPAPAPAGLILQPGDRLAICGDSITEQKMYSRLIETYLTACVPESRVTVRQYGWGGETAPGFLARMTNDCLRFAPTLAITCYGMNDHGYRAYEPGIGERYREASRAIIRAFLAAGARVVQGSPGCVGPQIAGRNGSADDLNRSLCELRNIGIELAAQEQVGFADVFWPMLTAGRAGQQKYGPDYFIAGKDAVHPDWAGHFVMAYAFLKALGLDGDLGTFTVDLVAGRATATPGHEINGLSNGALTLTSHRYPFYTGGDLNRHDSIRSAMTLIPFNAHLNRLTLIVKGEPGKDYRVVWGDTSRSYSAAQLAQGVNLAEDFIVNPFSQPFKQLDDAVAAKQAYETRQVKMLFHGDEGRVDPEATVALTERARQVYVDAVAAAFAPLTHTIRILAE